MTSALLSLTHGPYPIPLPLVINISIIIDWDSPLIFAENLLQPLPSILLPLTNFDSLDYGELGSYALPKNASLYKERKEEPSSNILTLSPTLFLTILALQLT